MPVELGSAQIDQAQQQKNGLIIEMSRIYGPSAGGAAEALNQALSYIPPSNGEENGNGYHYYGEVPSFSRIEWAGSDCVRQDPKPTYRYTESEVITPTGVKLTVINIPFGPREYDNNYLGVNKMLWSLYHGFPEHYRFDEADWEAIKDVNRNDAAIVASRIRPGDRVMVNDYQKIMFSKYFREIPGMEDVPTFHFAHTAFPKFAHFQLLPEHVQKDLMEGYLSNNQVGFHTQEYVGNFVESVEAVLPEAKVDHTPDGVKITYNGRSTIIDAFPIGVSRDYLRGRAYHNEVTMQDAAAIRVNLGDRKMWLNAARRDYIKGFPEALDAVERAFEAYEDLREHVVYVQGDQTTRKGIDEFDVLGPAIKSRIDRISERFKTPTWPTPVEHYEEGFARDFMDSREIEGDVLLISSIRDGFNLMIPEFIALNRRNGVPVVSNQVGAVEVYRDAILSVDITDPDETAEALHYATFMSEEEKARKHKRGTELVIEHDVHSWLGRQDAKLSRIVAGEL